MFVESQVEPPRVPKEPKTIQELFDFYHGYVKLLYSRVQASNVLPQETLFEINAALDHISRMWVYQEPEQEVVHHAFAHFKRSCLDIFKIIVRDTIDLYQEIKKVDTSIIDNGEFDRQLHLLIQSIKNKSTEARRLEGRQAKDDHVVVAFEPWTEVYAECIKFEHDFYLNPNLGWARRKQRKRRVIDLFLGFFGAVIINAIISAEIFGIKVSTIWTWLTVNLAKVIAVLISFFK
ncbi:MAG: hypothetical protein ABFD69_14575 [Candidatus Sumerlaeia bacterium]